MLVKMQWLREIVSTIKRVANGFNADNGGPSIVTCFRFTHPLFVSSCEINADLWVEIKEGRADDRCFNFAVRIVILRHL